MPSQYDVSQDWGMVGLAEQRILQYSIGERLSYPYLVTESREMQGAAAPMGTAAACHR